MMRDPSSRIDHRFLMHIPTSFDWRCNCAIFRHDISYERWRSIKYLERSIQRNGGGKRAKEGVLDRNLLDSSTTDAEKVSHDANLHHLLSGIHRSLLSRMAQIGDNKKNALLAIRVFEYLTLRERFLASSNPQTDDPTILTAETRCDGKLWRAGSWPVHRVRALVKTNLSIALESGGAGSAERRRSARSLAAPMEPSITAAGVVLVAESEAHERSRTLSVSASAEERERERQREKEIVEERAATSTIYAAARRDSSLLGVYGRRVSAVYVRIVSAVFGSPRTRQPRRTFVQVEAERGLRGDGGEEEEDEASRGGFPFSYGRYIPTFSSSTYLVNSVTIRHFLFLAK
ncbi:hypothetical protein ALC53_06165 [Atta colombica]|uniref:Uncharacterized protein n=1 Tax=Atta colombica TaxID=520822 RepID=A0A195BFQ6_9HYME|nr:hypothetical protein ALC53_06165 [Atta colombica]